MPAIEVSHVTKEFRLGALQSLKQKLVNTGARLIGRAVEAPPLFKALDDVNFSIEPGEVVGIIGHNGAGKSTLLKMLARISTPTSGHVKVNGRVAPLIEVGAGFVGDFTGRENVYLNAAILGMSKKEIERKFDEIVDFAEMSEFIDTPVKRYSSGMQVKLAFAVATSIESEILIVDEVLAVGDLAFQRKCFDRMEDMIKRQNRTVLLVSHNIRQVERLCPRVLMMNHGHVLHDGRAKDVCNAFYEQNDDRIVASRPGGQLSSHRRFMSSGEIDLIAIQLVNRDGQPCDEVEHQSEFAVEMHFQVHTAVTRPKFGIGVHTTDFLYLSTSHVPDSEVPQSLEPGVHRVLCRVARFPFLPGTYALRVGISVGERGSTAFYVENAHIFRAVSQHLSRSDPDVSEGFVPIETRWCTNAGTVAVGAAAALAQQQL